MSFSPQANDDDYFTNINYCKNIECILSTTELTVVMRANGIQTQKSCYLYAEKMDFKGLIQLRLTEKCDQRRMYVTTVDSASFNDLKQDQALHVTFAGFIEHLVRLLQDCQQSKLELHLLQLQRPLSGNYNCSGVQDTVYQLQFVEMRPFKNLVHLCLPSQMASLNVVLFYMSSTLDAAEKRMALKEGEVQQVQHELRLHKHRIDNLEGENKKLRDNLLENTRNTSQIHAEEVQLLHSKLQQAIDQRQADNERHRNKTNTLQAQIDQLSMEKSNIVAEKMHDQKRYERTYEELNSAKSLVATLKEQVEKLQQEAVVLKNQERKYEMHLSDSRKNVLELQEKLRKFDKTKADIVAELEAEKKITHTKRQALQIATDEITKANEIILKQSIELKKLRKTIEWRTEVALHQEKAITEKERQLRTFEEEAKRMENTVKDLREEIPKQLESMRAFATSLEHKYTEQIKALRHKLKLTGKENHSSHANVNHWEAKAATKRS